MDKQPLDLIKKEFRDSQDSNELIESCVKKAEEKFMNKNGFIQERIASLMSFKINISKQLLSISQQLQQIEESFKEFSKV